MIRSILSVGGWTLVSRATGFARDVVMADAVDGSSLIEALETLPRDGWVSSRGRSITPEGMRRLRSLLADVKALREVLGDELTTDVELTAVRRVAGRDMFTITNTFADAGGETVHSMHTTVVGVSCDEVDPSMTAAASWT